MNPQQEPASPETHGFFTELNQNTYYCIEHPEQMAPFFMSLVSGSDHWCFISSLGGLSAGRMNAERALFPYYTEDKLTDLSSVTGGVSMVRLQDEFWKPFASPELMPIGAVRKLYKSVQADELIFEESWQQIRYRVSLTFSERFGLVRQISLENLSDQQVEIEVLDGWQNVLPALTKTDAQLTMSNLLDAYKTSELLDDRFAAFSFSSQLSDLAEPAECLRANVVWSLGNHGRITLSPLAPQQFALGNTLEAVQSTRGQRGAYLVHQSLKIKAMSAVQWYICAEVHLDQIQTVNLLDQVNVLTVDDLTQDIKQTRIALLRRVAVSDGLQLSQDALSCHHHYANCLFNIMRGGMVDAGYQLSKRDLVTFLNSRHHGYGDHGDIRALPDDFSLERLNKLAFQTEDSNLKRLCLSYIPISFSRRHGDPSRPWNRFSINLKDDFGNEKLDYQGNWRDIFQNWEPLGLSYPGYFPNMISVFLNATTLDGYNPYRVTKDGIEWEEPEPDNPWVNIGYWSDHQIVYLSKLLEGLDHTIPEALIQLMQYGAFSYSDVPYRIKGFDALKKDPHNSIEFDHVHNQKLKDRAQVIGGDGKFLANAQGELVHVSMLDKLMSLWLAKLSNFVPGGGLWMNTQRPEWNDANNALVGWGMSMVTTAYLVRHLRHIRQVLHLNPFDAEVSAPLWQNLERIGHQLQQLDTELNDTQRYQTLEKLACIGEDYRNWCYQRPIQRQTVTVKTEQVVKFLDQVLVALEKTVHQNKRSDNLYNSYNLLYIQGQQASVDYLELMLEGQVAVLSSGALSAEEALAVLTQLRRSPLFREDQYTYLLYPNKLLPGFLKRNQVDARLCEQIPLAKALIQDPEQDILGKDNQGNVRFQAEFSKVAYLNQALDQLAIHPAYKALVAQDRQALCDLYEATFQHRKFTGRSGSFFAYEGLGSTYWHMVSKLLLAAQECWQQAKKSSAPETEALADIYYDIRQGLGFNKTPSEYGAFPTDPYSHTPETGLARQPGMTGQVKEELLTRQVEMGVNWYEGQVHFDLQLLRQEEFLQQEMSFTFVNIQGQWQQISVPSGAVAFTLCQIPIIVQQTDHNGLVIHTVQGDQKQKSLRLSLEQSKSIAARSGNILSIEVFVAR